MSEHFGQYHRPQATLVVWLSCQPVVAHQKAAFVTVDQTHISVTFRDSMMDGTTIEGRAENFTVGRCVQLQASSDSVTGRRNPDRVPDV